MEAENRRAAALIQRCLILSTCPRFACRVCRTKTGWSHQPWCELSWVTEPDCTDCRYWNKKKDLCEHPTARRERAAK